MKIYKLTCLTFVFAACVLQSCNTNDDELFDKPASQRMDAYLSHAKEVLSSSENGWVFDYYPHKERKIGGCTYVVKFKDDKVDAQLEFAPGKVLKSTYAMVVGNGPILSFDTYNKFLHIFATPNAKLYEGYNGDFEFVIDSIGQDVIKVHGNRCMNVMYLRRLKEKASDYLQKVSTISSNFLLSSTEGTIGNKSAELDFDTNLRQVSFTVDGKPVASSAYNFTDKGIRLYMPIVVNGVTINELSYDAKNMTLKAPQVVLDKYLLDPNYIRNMISEDKVIFAPTEGLKRTIPHVSGLEQFKITTDSEDWIKITTEGNNLTLEITKCTHFRIGTITISNGKQKVSLKIAQM